MIARSPVLMTLVGIVLAACAVTMNDSRIAAHGAGSLPFACALHARSDGQGTRIEARLEASRALPPLSYQLRIRGSGVAADQSGTVSAEAGESLLLGEANLSRSLDDLDVRLTVSTDGRSVTCPLQVD